MDPCGEDASDMKGWKIIKDNESGITELQPLEKAACPPGVLPWRSSHGYQVTDGGWILSPTKKQLLWLPHSWRSHEKLRTWSGQFLGLQHIELPEIVILEFFIE